MAYREQDEATSSYISYMVYMIIAQTVVILEERCCHRRPTSGSWPWEKNLEPVQNVKIRSDPMERIHAQVMRLSTE